MCQPAWVLRVAARSSADGHTVLQSAPETVLQIPGIEVHELLEVEKSLSRGRRTTF